MRDAPLFPPLLKGLEAKADPFSEAVAAQAGEVEPGQFWYREGADVLRWAIVLAPEMPLAEAMGGLIAVELGLADALGALAPPEVAIQYGWPGRLLVNGANCGAVRVAASTDDPSVEPDWMVVGADILLFPPAEAEGGLTPDDTTLFAEGCAEISPRELLEACARHTLLWINTFLADGHRPLHEAWSGKCAGLGAEIEVPKPGQFLGIDERGGMILKTEAATEILPLTTALEAV